MRHIAYPLALLNLAGLTAITVDPRFLLVTRRGKMLHDNRFPMLGFLVMSLKRQDPKRHVRSVRIVDFRRKPSQ